MSDKSIIIGDDMIETQLKENSKKLSISLEELIDRYIRIGLYMDDYYKQPKLSKEKLMKIFKIDEQKKKNHSKDNSMDALVGIYKYSEE